MAAIAWRRREALLTSTKIHSIADGVALAQARRSPAARPRSCWPTTATAPATATWLLREIIAQDLSKTLIATIADRELRRALLADGARPGDAFDLEVGGLADASAGEPVRITGTVRAVGSGVRRGATEPGSASISARGNVLVISPYLAQIIELSTLTAIGLDPAAFDVIAIKSRVHFRRGFDDSGFAKTILLVEPPEPFLGTVRLDGLPYDNVDLARYYPYGDVAFDPARDQVVAVGSRPPPRSDHQ